MTPKLMELFRWTNKDYALVNIFFKAAYAVGLVIIVSLVDRLNTKKGWQYEYALPAGARIQAVF